MGELKRYWVYGSDAQIDQDLVCSPATAYYLAADVDAVLAEERHQAEVYRCELAVQCERVALQEAELARLKEELCRKDRA